MTLNTARPGHHPFDRCLAATLSEYALELTRGETLVIHYHRNEYGTLVLRHVVALNTDVGPLPPSHVHCPSPSP